MNIAEDLLMKWTEIRIKTTEEACDAVSEMLTTIGAGGVVIEDPNEIRRHLESLDSPDYADQSILDPLGSDVTVKAYFDQERDPGELAAEIRERLKTISRFLYVGKGSTEYETVDDEDWSESWKKHYKPFHISKSVVVKPSWEEYAAIDGDIIIELDPGMAFGTGTHETTRLCAQLLESYVKKGDHVVDVGCGTGILSIIAYKLGASRVDAVDIDETAVRTAKENCAVNGAEHGVSVRRGVLSDLPRVKADIVAANIIADVIIDLSGIVGGYLEEGGILIVSGIIRDRKQEVIKVYDGKGFELAEMREMGEWVAMVFRWQGFS
jgi:ribosomal protein L11 methyltransferase